jgi:hypothetical protein
MKFIHTVEHVQNGLVSALRHIRLEELTRTDGQPRVKSVPIL